MQPPLPDMIGLPDMVSPVPSDLPELPPMPNVVAENLEKETVTSTTSTVQYRIHKDVFAAAAGICALFRSHASLFCWARSHHSVYILRSVVLSMAHATLLDEHVSTILYFWQLQTSTDNCNTGNDPMPNQ